jgi:predicted nucleic-acid-binding protein
LIGIDTNVLIRWNVDEESNPAQSESARQAITGRGERVYINAVVLAESVWVMSNAYRVDRTEQRAFVRVLLDHPQIVLSDREVVMRALNAFESGGPGLADYLIGELNAAAGCRTTLTFDKAAGKTLHFTQLT